MRTVAPAFIYALSILALKNEELELV